MAKIIMKFLGDITKKTWVYEEDFQLSYSFSASIGFRDNDKLPVNFNNLKFGYEIILNNQEIFTYSKPDDGIDYICTDQYFIDSSYINNLFPDQEYSIRVWAENSEENWDQVFNFVLPKPQKPFESWVWDKETHLWVPPKPIPSTTLDYSWNEDIQEWIFVEHFPEEDRVPGIT
jgi:hypothetical protein